MNKSMDQVLQELDSKIPREEVSSREAGQGRKLDYVSSYYVISQLNRILGPNNWGYTSEVTKLHEGTIEDRYGKPVHTVHYTAKVRLAVKFPDGETTEYGDYGYGDGTDKVNPGKAHELAIKESITDGLKRCAKNLGNRIGLALYSKEQENVAEAPVAQASPAPAPAAQANRDTINKQITATAKVVAAKGKKTLDEIRAGMQNKYKKQTAAELTDDQALEFLNELKGIANG